MAVICGGSSRESWSLCTRGFRQVFRAMLISYSQIRLLWPSCRSRFQLVLLVAKFEDSIPWSLRDICLRCLHLGWIKWQSLCRHALSMYSKFDRRGRLAPTYQPAFLEFWSNWDPWVLNIQDTALRAFSSELPWLCKPDPKFEWAVWRAPWK